MIKKELHEHDNNEREIKKYLSSEWMDMKIRNFQYEAKQE